MTLPRYAELHCLSNFTFLRGASHPEELVERATALGYGALALTDECSVAGVVRAHVAAKSHGLKLIIGSEFRLACGLRLVLLAENRAGYAALCRLISAARRRADKGQYRIERAAFTDGVEGCLALWLADEGSAAEDADWLRERFPARAWLAVELHVSGVDMAKAAHLIEFSRRSGLPVTAAGDVHMHVRSRRALQDTLTAIRLKTPVGQLGTATRADQPGLFPNGERSLRAIGELAAIYPPALLAETIGIADRCCFSLDELRYEYPHELVPPGHTPTSWLRVRTEEGLRHRWPAGAPPDVSRLVERELALIAELGYEHYFLTVDDLVCFARRRGILCQGRGSAANSAVCFCLGITEVDPARMSVLFERFMSRERNEPPDIDIDFEHDRREEVIQYIYGKYGRERAALTATVITYCPRSAIRDVGRALSLAENELNSMARAMQWWDGRTVRPERVREAGLDPEHPTIHRLIRLVSLLIGFPRHLSQHVGGFVMSEEPLTHLVPVENAAMAGRTVIQWDKDDLDELGILKVDVLALGMLSAVRRAFELIRRHTGRDLSLHSVPAEDPAVYDMICRADTMGVFQIESRAQMAMLPRLRPRCFYDLVIEVAIIRPGPIQGDMVHPYLRRRSGEEAVTYPSEAVRGVLERTLGVPIFQEQVMQLAVVAAGFTPGEADQLRRAMAAWKRKGGLGPFEQRLISGMAARGYSEAFAQQIFRQIEGFGEYGFPESHAASFALLVYVSAWLKCHEPEAFTCALLNSQPMGFYAPSQLVQSAARHGVQLLPVDINRSDYESTLENVGRSRPAVRLGLHLVSGLSAQAARRLVALRAAGGAYRSVQHLSERSGLHRDDLAALAAAGALAPIAGHRHRARWEVAGVEATLPVFPAMHIAEGVPMLRAPVEGQDIVADYASTGLTLRRHPLALLRPQLDRRQVIDATSLWSVPDHQWVYTAGLVITRQRPGSAGGVIFVTLEDETGYVNLIVWEAVAERQRNALLQSRLMAVWGRVQREGDVLHVIAARLDDLTPLLGGLVTRSRDFS